MIIGMHAMVWQYQSLQERLRKHFHEQADLSVEQRSIKFSFLHQQKNVKLMSYIIVCIAEKSIKESLP